MRAMDWNRVHPTGTLVEVTLADGRAIKTRTLGPARTWGGMDHVEVAGIRGYVLLSWVAPRAVSRDCG
jgi:hypothetical protein